VLPVAKNHAKGRVEDKAHRAFNAIRQAWCCLKARPCPTWVAARLPPSSSHSNAGANLSCRDKERPNSEVQVAPLSDPSAAKVSTAGSARQDYSRVQGQTI
jgi:hypothetical protein